MAIPNALIPSDEKRSVNKPRLVFAVVVIGLFGLATVGSLVSVVLKQFTPALTDEDVVVVGHCCESGDLMTPKDGEPEDLAERSLRKAEIGDILDCTENAVKVKAHRALKQLKENYTRLEKNLAI